MDKLAIRRLLSRRAVLLIPLAGGLLLGTIGVWAAGQDEGKAPPNPDAGLTDAQRAASIAQLKERNAAGVEDFVKEGRDPRGLPVVDMETYSPGAVSPEEAQAQAEAMVEAIVVGVTYVPSTDGLTESRATVKVSQVMKGQSSGVVVIEQIGGPAWSPSGGELQQLEGDPLLLPGQHVLLLLRSGSSPSEYRTVYGAGVYLVTDKGIQAPHSNAFGSRVNGMSVEVALAVLR